MPWLFGWSFGVGPITNPANLGERGKIEPYPGYTELLLMAFK